MTETPKPGADDADAGKLVAFIKDSVMVGRELKGRDDLLELAEIELQRSLATVARFQRARNRLFALTRWHSDPKSVIAEVEDANRATREPMVRLYAISLLLPEEQGQAFLDRYAAAIEALPKGGRPAIV